MYTVTVLPQERRIEAKPGQTLLTCLRSAGLAPSAPCGGNGSCGKCKVILQGREVLACRTVIDRDMAVTVPPTEQTQILTQGVSQVLPVHTPRNGALLIFDIGTTTVAGCLLDGQTGRELAVASCLNPQHPYGADVITRIQNALKGHMDAQTTAIRQALTDLTEELCRQASISVDAITLVNVVGNPAMQQLFLGLIPENLARIPFAPVLTMPQCQPAEQYLPLCKNAQLLTVPDIAGYVGADTVACLLSTGMAESEELCLLVDIGTNAELVLGNQYKMAACSAAAGPVLEGANIRFGMRAAPGAIDHVTVADGKLVCSVIGGGEATGICGSGIIDAVAAALELGLVNRRGRVQDETRQIPLAGQVCLTQEDIRQVQLAKGAVAAGIQLLAKQLGVRLEDIQKVYLAGAFGSFLNVESACCMGLLPQCLQAKTQAVGNAALTGAKAMACNTELFCQTKAVLDRIETVELGSLPEFTGCFAKHMGF